MANRDERVGVAVAWYFQQVEAGTPPSREAFLARFPDLRAELESFLADKGAFDRAAGPGPAPHPDLTATIVFLLVSGLGWAVVALTRPADRATALAAGLLAGLTAGFAMFVMTGPLEVIRAQLQLQARYPVEPQEVGGSEQRAPPLSSAAPAGRIEPTRAQFTGAFAGVWLGLFRTALPFAVFGALTAWAADHLRRTRGTRWQVLVPYLEIALSALLGAVVGLLGTHVLGQVVLTSFPEKDNLRIALRFWVSFIAPLALTAPASIGVLRGWRWWWRWLGYLGWFGLMVLFITSVAS
jgi:hypothetical protein